MQEKPIANSVKAAASAIVEHRGQTQPPVWVLAENYRCNIPLSHFRDLVTFLSPQVALIDWDTLACQPAVIVSPASCSCISINAKRCCFDLVQCRCGAIVQV